MSVRTVQLGEVATIERRAATEAECANLPFVGLEHVESGSGNFAHEFKRRPAPIRATKFRFGPEHVLYGKLRPYLNKVVLPDFDGVCTTEILPILPKRGAIDRRFLYALLLSPCFVRWASLRVLGANLPRLDPGMLEEFSFDLPSLPEQEHIASVLVQADRLRRTRRYALELSDTFLPAAFLKLFGDPDTDPNGAPIVEFGELLDYVTSGARGWAEYYVSRGLRFIRSLDVRMNYISDEDAVFVAPPRGAEANRTRVRTDDVLLTITGSQIGRVAPVPTRLDGASISQHVAIIRLKPGLLPVFLSWYLSLESGGQREIARLQYGQTKPGLNFAQIREFRIPLPSIKQQQHFGALVARYDRLQAGQREAVRQANHCFQSLLYEVFTANR